MNEYRTTIDIPELEEEYLALSGIYARAEGKAKLARDMLPSILARLTMEFQNQGMSPTNARNRALADDYYLKKMTEAAEATTEAALAKGRRDWKAASVDLLRTNAVA